MNNYLLNLERSFFLGSYNLVNLDYIEVKFGFVAKLNSIKINLGPQHPSMHGVLRLTVYLIGESVVNVDVHIGLLHRGTEKLIEYKTYTQAIPYLDRLDYVSAITQELAFSHAVEKLLTINVNVKAQLIRVIYSELTRILNHLLAITTAAMDVGALTPFLWGFEEREKIMEFYERVSGGRLHPNYIVPGGVVKDLPTGLVEDIYQFIMQFPNRIDEIEEMLKNNRIFKQRLVDVGIIDRDLAVSCGLSGPVLRASGIAWDLRYNEPYDFYDKLNFVIHTGVNGDCYDRYIVRINEMRESIYIIEQCLSFLNQGWNSFFYLYHDVNKLFEFNDESYFVFQNPIFQNPFKFRMKSSMEDLIQHFKFYTEGYSVPEDAIYTPVEAPKGEFGVYLVSDGTNRPYRCSFRSPDLPNLIALAEIAAKNYYNLADLVAIVASVDLVLGSTDC